VDGAFTTESAMNVKQVREHYLVYLDTIHHGHHLEELGRFYAEDVVFHPELPQPGLAGLRPLFEVWFAAFPDFHVTVDDLLYVDGIIATRVTLSGTHTGGPFMGFPASGRAFRCIDHCYYRLQHGKFTEVWDLPDNLTMLQQLGIATLLQPGA
jgi:steroid delta-isomerase-like uncharacterized protein